MDQSKPVRLRFGPFEADLATEELFAHAEKVPLQAKPFQFLATLLMKPGTLLSREQMSHSLWPDIYVQVNQGLNAAARKVRIALGDDPNSPKYIETQGSKGYRFIHPVEVVRWSSEGPDADWTTIRMAVIPLGDDGQGDFAIPHGIAAELTRYLGRIHRSLAIIGSDSSGSLQQNAVDVAAIRRELRLRYVLTIMVRQAENRIRLTATLLAGEGLERIWEETYERERKDVFAIQNEIATHLVPLLLPPSLQAITVPVLHKVKFPAYEEYLRGRYQLDRRDPEGLRLAKESFQRSIELDRNFGMAYAGLADTFNLLASRGLMLPRAGYQQALQSAEMATRLDPNAAEALVPLAWAQLSLDHDWASATRNFERALHLIPQYAFAYHGYAYLLASRGRIEEAVAATAKARQIEPLSAPIHTLSAAMAYFAGSYDDALQLSRRALSMQEDFASSRSWMGLAYLAQRRYTEAIEQMEAALEISQGSPLILAEFAYACADAGRTNSARELLRKVESHNNHTPQPSYHIGLVHLALGEVNQALDWIEHAIQERVHWTLFMAIDPRLHILRGSKRFDKLCKAAREPDPHRIRNFG